MREGLARVWEPRTVILNGSDFVVELAPTAEGHDLEEVSAEDYYPELHDLPAGTPYPKKYVLDFKLLHKLCFVGYEKTVEVFVRVHEEHRRVVPDAIDIPSAEVGRYDYGTVKFGDDVLQAQVVFVRSTDPGERDEIDCHRRALASRGAAAGVRRERKAPAMAGGDLASRNGQGNDGGTEDIAGGSADGAAEKEVASRSPQAEAEAVRRESDSEFALEGARYQIAADFQSVLDKNSGQEISGYGSVTALALEYMVANCRSKARWVRGNNIVDGVRRLYEKRHGRPCDGYGQVIDYFRVSAGRGTNRKRTLEFYGKNALVRNNGRGSMYWLDVGD